MRHDPNSAHVLKMKLKTERRAYWYKKLSDPVRGARIMLRSRIINRKPEPTVRYMPHQGEREIARRLRRET